MSLRKKLRSCKSETVFLTCIIILILIAGYILNRPTLAMWFGFLVAGYSAISNDSIQTLGTFLSSNKKVKWYWLWLFLGSILVATIMYGWYSHSGDISYGRLNKIPAPQTVSFAQLVAPIVLLVLTRFKMPVSTTFLLLSVFSSGKTIGEMLNKTFMGYFIAFGAAALFWGVIAYYIKKKKYHEKPRTENVALWRVFQWCATAFLWSAWLMQDNANFAVFLPRDMNFTELIIVVSLLFIGMGYMLYKRGGPIQTIIEEKTDVIYVKSATMIDLLYGFILVYLKWINDLPMSTTWVFLGLLAGREVALTQISGKEEPYRTTLALVMKDLFRAAVGLIISLILAIIANPQLLSEIKSMVG